MKKAYIHGIEAGVGRICLDDEGHQNRLTTELVDDLMEALRALASDDGVKAVLLTGRQEIFCAGATREILRAVSSGRIVPRDLELPSYMVDFPVPIVAALEGSAVGAGLGLGLYCDISVASETGRYGLNYNSMGFTPGMGVTGLLPLLVGHGFSTEMMMTSKFYRGRELAGRGLFTHVVAADKVLGVALDIVRRIASQPRYVTTLLKADLSAIRREALSKALAREHVMHAACFARPDTRATIEASYFEPAAAPPSTPSPPDARKQPS